MLLLDCLNHLLVDGPGSKEAVASGELNPGTVRQSGVTDIHISGKALRARSARAGESGLEFGDFGEVEVVDFHGGDDHLEGFFAGGANGRAE
jgi:hypothetical protein